ncbi:cytochrome c peroxidase [Paraflavisolibacter sp. H34]|uniref:cytochrome-c peroxidase n=1 Tax=Huijunlia imazamoxiresistens TaxID=3127457 RepID=UPI00301A790E
MQRTNYIIALLAGLIACSALLVGACRKPGTPAMTEPTPLSFTVPAGFPAVKYNLAENPLTREGFELGRRLFYDGRLSKDGNFPCASCHQQFAAFATFEHDLSHGFDNQFTTRNAPGLANLAWQAEFHWDGGVNHLDLQPLAPLTAPNEMAEDLSNVLDKLRRDTGYPRQFRAAFGTDEINSQRMLKALSQFMVPMVSANSKYDKVKRGEGTFYYYEQAGYETFKAKCATCHTEPLFTDFSYRNVGLPLSTSLKDYGRMRITSRREDSLRFRVPSLRNVALTFPYMHDGRFWTLEAVLDHYAGKVQQGPTIDPLVAPGISLSSVEKVNLVSFLRTLTDSTFIRDTRFAQP